MLNCPKNCQLTSTKLLHKIRGFVQDILQTASAIISQRKLPIEGAKLHRQCGAAGVTGTSLKLNFLNLLDICLSSTHQKRTSLQPKRRKNWTKQRLLLSPMHANQWSEAHRSMHKICIDGLKLSPTIRKAYHVR